MLPGATPSRSDACASVVPHLWNVLPCSGSPGQADDDEEKGFQHGGLALDQPHVATVAPFGEGEREQRQQDDRHVPELALLDARSRRARRSGRPRPVGHGVGRVEPAAGFLGDAPQRRGVHRRVEVLGLARRRAHVAGARAERRRRPASRPRSLRRRRARLLTNVPRYWPSRSPVHCSGTFIVPPPGRVTCATTVASFILDERLVHDRRVDLHRLARLDAIGHADVHRRRARRPPSSASAAARTARASDPRAESTRASAIATSPAR